ncbi:MAG: hypothetical protein IRY99_17120, partial [Isosphaeraceae bacterium]|nr:hypothetical protein [Isosphaeraceae bacterium]
MRLLRDRRRSLRAALRWLSRRHARRRRPAGARRFRFEGLEPRDLPAAILPDVALTSATTADSRSVTLAYDIRDAALAQPLEIGLYRSADDQFDAGDLPIGSMIINPPDGAAATRDQDGQPAGSIGPHRLT